MDSEIIVNSIKSLCKNKDISASQLEKEIGLSQGLISKWQKTMPSLDKIIDIADYFHVSLDDVIGRDPHYDDKFLEMLYHETDKNILKWQPNYLQNTNKIKLPIREDYNEEIFIEIAYYTEFNEGYFIINCLCEYHKTINPVDLELYIKPDDKSSLVYQEYTIEELKPLWIAIIKNLVDGAPDEIKVENLKQQFLMKTSVSNKNENNE